MSGGLLLGGALGVPLAAALGVLLLARYPNRREALTLVAGAVLFGLVLLITSVEAPPTLVLAEPVPGLALTLTVEPLGALFALVASFLWPVTTLYAIGYMRSHGEGHQTRFYCAFALAIAATLGIALAGNLFTLFVFYELLTLSTYPLVTHSGSDEARRAGRLYLGMLMSSSIGLLLLALIWTWHLTGTLTFTKGGIFPPGIGDGVLSLLLLLYVLGTAKAALMPLHRWLPAAMVAPTPVSALLHAVAVVKAGVFTVLKVAVYIFGLERLGGLLAAELLAYLAGFSILAASLVAITCDNLKARLAYSTVSQLGYIVMGAMLGVSAGVAGASLHVAMHAFAKITLFFCAGAVLVATRRRRVSELDGLGRQMPLTMGAFLVGALSIVGLPPFGGTWSKWLLLQGTLDSGLWVLTAVLWVSSLLNIGYLVVIPVRAFFCAPAEPAAVGVREAPGACLLALLLTATVCVLLFFLPGPFYRLSEAIL
ncbi:proton-conducting transporter membrane subunit [Motiliproteus sp. SC1-56]|uniref:proton-conducting transporter transmembrane domain-containing protein n=1 Tax=Motiliproteus sp. SC1-56 TaxID=2799565 RepID=UPI001A8D6A2F|nr:proton-conducting transporter membrane subunit [Motiliproteus sp. SC1-56]